jgi:MFS family permease
LSAPTEIATPRPGFLGWRIAVLATITMVMTGPGQTIGVSVFVDPMIEALGLTRSELSTAYLIGTLLGAVALIPVGRWIDRVGQSRAMTLIGIAFGAALLLMSGVQGFATLVLGFVFIRWLGQGSLQLVSTLSITPWFERRRGLVFGVSATTAATLMAFTPIVLGTVIGIVEWRAAWVFGAVAVWLIVVPIARFGIVDRPSDVGQYPDGDLAPHPEAEPPPVAHSYTRREALRQPRFWVLAMVGATTSMLFTALTFHQISILGEQGLTVTEAAAMFIPQVLGLTLAGLLSGALSDKVPARFLLASTMALLASSLALAALLAPGWPIVLYAVVVGAAAGAQRPLVATLLPRWFGLGHIGSIQGVSALLMVAASATGPVALSLAAENLGGYAPAALLLMAIPIGVGLAALTISEPEFKQQT